MSKNINISISVSEELYNKLTKEQSKKSFPSLSHTTKIILKMFFYKRCPSCDEWKEYSEFNKNSSKGDGYESQCKECKKLLYKTKN